MKLRKLIGASLDKVTAPIEDVVKLFEDAGLLVHDAAKASDGRAVITFAVGVVNNEPQYAKLEPVLRGLKDLGVGKITLK